MRQIPTEGGTLSCRRPDTVAKMLPNKRGQLFYRFSFFFIIIIIVVNASDSMRMGRNTLFFPSFSDIFLEAIKNPCISYTQAF